MFKADINALQLNQTITCPVGGSLSTLSGCAASRKPQRVPREMDLQLVFLAMQAEVTGTKISLP